MNPGNKLIHNGDKLIGNIRDAFASGIRKLSAAVSRAPLSKTTTINFQSNSSLGRYSHQTRISHSPSLYNQRKQQSSLRNVREIALPEEEVMGLFHQHTTRLSEALNSSTPLAFSTSTVTGYYGIIPVSHGQLTIKDGEGNRTAMDLRLLGWKPGIKTHTHGHDGNGELQSNQIACSFTPLTPGGAEVRYNYLGNNQAEIRDVSSLPPGETHIDRHSKDSDKYVHAFISPETALPHILIDSNGNHIQVGILTANAYADAESNKAAPSLAITDVNPALTAGMIERFRATSQGTPEIKNPTIRRDAIKREILGKFTAANHERNNQLNNLTYNNRTVQVK